MEDFDILYLMKTPFFMGKNDEVVDEARSVDINEDDSNNLTLKNLILVRALTAKNDFESLKGFMQGLLAGENAT